MIVAVNIHFTTNKLLVLSDFIDFMSFKTNSICMFIGHSECNQNFLLVVELNLKYLVVFLHDYYFYLINFL